MFLALIRVLVNFAHSGTLKVNCYRDERRRIPLIGSRNAGPPARPDRLIDREFACRQGIQPSNWLTLRVRPDRPGAGRLEPWST